MTDVMKNELEKSLQDEQMDHEKYLKLSEQAKTEGCMKMSKILKDIAHDEGVHARFLMDLLGKDS